MDTFYGIFKKVGDLFVDKSINQLYDKEYHGVLKLPNGKYAYSQYMGPGTRLDIRVPRGDKGLTPIDEASMGHDIRYRLAMKKQSKEDVKQAIREADNIFNNVIDRLRKEGKEDELNLKQAELIKVKVFLEGNSVLRDYIFNFNTRKTGQVDSPELDAMFERELKRLQQKGYGDKYFSKEYFDKLFRYFPALKVNKDKWYKQYGISGDGVEEDDEKGYTGGFGFNSITAIPRF